MKTHPEWDQYLFCNSAFLKKGSAKALTVGAYSFFSLARPIAISDGSDVTTLPDYDIIMSDTYLGPYIFLIPIGYMKTVWRVLNHE